MVVRIDHADLRTLVTAIAISRGITRASNPPCIARKSYLGCFGGLWEIYGSDDIRDLSRARTAVGQVRVRRRREGSFLAA